MMAKSKIKQTVKAVDAYTVDEIKKLSRKEVRYCLYRMVSGNATASQQKVINFYKPFINEIGLEPHDFAVKWDVSEKDHSAIVQGSVVKRLQEKLHASLFDENGTLI